MKELIQVISFEVFCYEKCEYKKVILIILFLLVIYWLLCLAKCEMLTNLYQGYFREAYISENISDNIASIKVLKYSDYNAKVYIINKDQKGYSMGNVFTFKRPNDKWIYDSWSRTVWSKNGNAEGFVWPYIWHYFYPLISTSY